MTDAERREYMRKWRRNNREKVREQKQRRETRLAVEAIASVERLTDDVCVISTTDGREFTMLREAMQA